MIRMRPNTEREQALIEASRKCWTLAQTAEDRWPRWWFLPRRQGEVVAYRNAASEIINLTRELK